MAAAKVDALLSILLCRQQTLAIVTLKGCAHNVSGGRRLGLTR